MPNSVKLCATKTVIPAKALSFPVAEALEAITNYPSPLAIVTPAQAGTKPTDKAKRLCVLLKGKIVAFSL